ncbi:MAG: hypothetical protein ABEJ92_05850 [Halobacteriales archaeon]
MDLTLLELHLENAEFNAPFAGRAAGGDDGDDAESTSTGETAAADTGDEAGGQVGPGLVALLFGAVALALLARYLRGRADEQTTLDELEA